jgi:hypothetical protein
MTYSLCEPDSALANIKHASSDGCYQTRMRNKFYDEEECGANPASA